MSPPLRPRPNVCGSDPNNSLNFSNFYKSEERLQGPTAACTCTLKSALHRLPPFHLRAQASFLHQASKTFLEILPSLHSTSFVRRIQNQERHFRVPRFEAPQRSIGSRSNAPLFFMYASFISKSHSHVPVGVSEKHVGPTL